MSKKNLGATGKFPDGKLNQDDEGELRMAVGVRDGNVILDFGKPVHWLGLPKEHALKLAEMLQKKAEEL